ncbi:MAG: MATE family efflux transporter [Rikenellaceae bacterium]
MNTTLHEDRLGTEKMLPLILKMTMPAVAAQIINLLYSIIDRVYIGHIEGIGTNALAGVGVTSSTIILITAFSAIVGIGGAPLASIALGQGNRERAEKILGNGAMLLVIFTIVTMVVTYGFMDKILYATGASDNTIGFANDYLNTYLIGTIFVLISTGLNTFINVQGRPSIAMWAVIIGAVLNISLDPLFIFTFDMGVRGAALATVISQFVSALIIILFLTSKKATLKLTLSNMKLRRRVVGGIMALGFSPFIMASTEAIVGFVLNGSLKYYGDIHISAMAIIQSALLFVSVPITGFSQGFMPIIGYNFGHNYMDRVKECFKIVLIIMTSFNFILITTMIIIPHHVSHIFTNDGELIMLLQKFMPIFFFGMTLFGVQRTCQSMFIALGQAKISIFIAILRKIILLIPLALILPNYIGVEGIYLAESISDATAAICCAIIFFIAFPRIVRKGAKVNP